MARFGRDTQEPDDGAVRTATPPARADVVPAIDNAEVTTYSPELVARVRDLVAGIPPADDDGGERIVEQLLDAVTIDDLNEPWEGTSGRKLAGQRLTIRGISARPSRFEGGAGIFLVADAVDAKTGDRRVFTTSAISAVIQLAVAYRKGMFPLLVEVVVAEQPTKRGFYPYHLRVLAAAGQAATGG